VEEGLAAHVRSRTGPYFVAFPNLRQALENNVPIYTQARACTILPNFVGCVAAFLRRIAR
jgi:ribosomal protein S19